MSKCSPVQAFLRQLEVLAPDGLVDSLVISGDEDMVTSQFSELLASGLDELMVTLLPIIDAGDEQFRLLHSIGGLKS